MKYGPSQLLAFGRRAGWRRTVQLVPGWGLDLTRPDHYGWRGYWHRCADRPDCLVASERNVDSIVHDLRTQYTVFIRIEPPDERPVDLRVSLAGSAKAIDSVCSSAASPGPDGTDGRG